MARIPSVAVIVTSLILALASGVVAQPDEGSEDTPSTVSLLSPGPLGQPYAEWASRAWQWKLEFDRVIPGFIGSESWPNLEFQPREGEPDCPAGARRNPRVMR